VTAPALSFDHVHLIARDPHATANWYVDMLGGRVTQSGERHGAPQVYIDFGGASVIVRGQRPNERAADKGSLEWGVDHFGLQVAGDFDGFCAELKRRGVEFSMEPTSISASTRIAFVRAPDGVSVELLSRNG